MKPRAWFSGLSSQLMISNASCGLPLVFGIARNDPPMFAGPPGPAATRHLPFVFGAAEEMSSACQAAPISVPRVPLPTAAFQLLSLIFALMPSCCGRSARSQARRMWSWSPMKWFDWSMNRVVPWPTTMLNTDPELLSRNVFGSACFSRPPSAK